MSGPVRAVRREQRFRPPAGANLEYLDLIGYVVRNHDGTVTVTPSSRPMELMLEGMCNYWDRKAVEAMQEAERDTA